MIKIAKELNKVISGLEYSGRYVEARELHDVFIKLSQIPPGVGAGMAAVNAGASISAGSSPKAQAVNSSSSFISF
jgi:hypothetical protein